LFLRVTLIAALVPLCIFGLGRATAASAPPALWVSTTGSGGAPCTKAAPCSSLDRAYEVAQPGQTVYVQDGYYGEQQINARDGKGPQYVIFAPAPGAHPTIEYVTVWGTYIEFRDLKINGWTSKPNAGYLTFRNITNAGFWIEGTSNVSIIRGSVGPGVDVHPIIAPEGTIVPKNILIYRVYFHDWTRSNADIHTECLQVGNADGFKITRSRFRNCAVFDVFMSYWGGGPPPQNITIENNYFDKPLDDGYYSVRFANYPDSWTNVLIRYNSALGGINVDRAPNLVNVQMIANVAPLPSGGCDSRIAYAYNVWQGTRCSATDANGANGFTDPDGLDLRPKAKSRSINRGDPKNFPTTDIDGHRRPLGKRPDAGAFETTFR